MNSFYFTVELKVSSFDLIISLDFILKIQQFLQTAANDDEYIEPPKLKTDSKTSAKGLNL